MNAAELEANPLAAERTVHDLNANPRLPLADESVDDAVCCVSVDYLVRPVEVFRDVARVLRPGGRFVCTFSNRLFPTKAVRGWLRDRREQHGDRGRVLPPVTGLRPGNRRPPHAAPRPGAIHCSQYGPPGTERRGPRPTSSGRCSPMRTVR